MHYFFAFQAIMQVFAQQKDAKAKHRQRNRDRRQENPPPNIFISTNIANIMSK